MTCAKKGFDLYQRFIRTCGKENIFFFIEFFEEGAGETFFQKSFPRIFLHLPLRRSLPAAVAHGDVGIVAADQDLAAFCEE